MRTLLVAATLLLLPEAVQAGGLRLKIGWHGRHGSVKFDIGHRRTPRHLPPPVRRVWVPGRYVERTEYVQVPGTWRTEWVPPAVEYVRVSGGREVPVVRPGHFRTVWVPPRTVPTTRRVWVPGHWR